MNWTDRRQVSIRSVQGKRFASPIILILFFTLSFLPAIVSAQTGGSLRIDSVNPNSVPVGEMVEITIEGEGFVNGSMIYLRNENATLNQAVWPIEYFSPNMINVTLEIPLDGLYNVVVWNPDLQEYTLEDGFTITKVSERPPESSLRINSVSPNSGRQGGSKVIGVFGDGFVEGCFVLLRNENVTLNTETMTINSTLLRITFDISLSPKVPGFYDVTVWNPDGQEYTLVNGFAVTEVESSPPGPGDIRIDSVSPNLGMEGETLQIEIVGSGFGSSSSRIGITIWGATIISEDLVSPTLIRATIWIRCDNTRSFLDVMVDDISGTDDVIRQAITVIESPEGCPQLRVESVSPTSGKQGETLLLEIIGEGFNPGTSIDPPLSIYYIDQQLVDSKHLQYKFNISSDFPAPQEVYFIVRSPSEDEGNLQTVRFYFDVERATTVSAPSLSPSSVPKGIPGFPYLAIALGLVIVLLLRERIHY